MGRRFVMGVGLLWGLMLLCGAHAIRVPRTEEATIVPETVALQTMELQPGELPLTDCLNNCSEHGRCLGNSGEKGTCACDQGYGRSTEKLPQDCSEYVIAYCPDTCHGRGDCVPSGGDLKCKCRDGIFGETCNHWHGCQGLKYCSGHGQCEISQDTEKCACFPGFTGAKCNIRVRGCLSNCAGRGVCAITSQTRTCECGPGFAGVSCEELTSSCPSHCSASGDCDHDTNTCGCSPGFAGSDCSNVTTPTGVCAHGYWNGESCTCVAPYKGPKCDVYDITLDPDCSALNFCSSKGVCHVGVLPEGVYGHKCTCFDGFKGVDCSQIDELEGCPEHCNGHGTCILSHESTCKCHSAWLGPSCSTSACSRDGAGNVCGGHGICEQNAEGEFHCTCDEFRANGELQVCELHVCPQDCSGNGVCNDGGICDCNKGFTGETCAEVVAPAAAAPAAQAEPEPTPKPTDQVAAAAAAVEEESPPCPEDCSGHGTCHDGICSCTNGFVGVACDIAPTIPEDDDQLPFLMQLEEDRAPPQKFMSRLWD
eukprot:c32414_g1_i1.p1 GENE.c32414_g1_i1~~c32414_g1_i1.p1  ORF type:complete len:537 (-),score=81.44 c32414_g1_i1:23-1633(-)